MNLPRQYVRVVRVPPDETPRWVRERWVGLELLLADSDRGPREAYTSEVLSGPRNRFVAALWGLFGRLQRQCYAVYVKEALEILQKTAPDAASWWRENVPRLRARPRKFLFQESLCEMVDRGVGEQAPVR